jgi:hypothetical protein
MPRSIASLADQVHLARAHVALGIAPTPVRIDDSKLWHTVDLERRSFAAEIACRVHRAVHGHRSTHTGRA